MNKFMIDAALKLGELSMQKIVGEAANTFDMMCSSGHPEPMTVICPDCGQTTTVNCRHGVSLGLRCARCGTTFSMRF